MRKYLLLALLVSVLATNQICNIVPKWEKTLSGGRKIIAIVTKNNPKYFPTEYICVFEDSKGNITVELICGPGEENVVKLEGEKARQYLKDHRLDF